MFVLNTQYNKDNYILAIRCPALNNPSNGILSTKERIYNTPVTYICKRGYRRVPSDGTITCQADGTWTPHSHITCQRKL